jgi:protein SCO1
VNQPLLARAFQVLTGVLLGLAVGFWLLRGRGEAPAEPTPSYFLADPIPAPDFVLRSQDGREVSSADLREKVLVVFFGYTSCPDVCPLTLSKLGEAFRRMGEEGDRIQVFLITVDPARDTPQRMAEYLAAFHPSFRGLSGTEEEIREVADAFGAFFVRTGEGESYTVDHTARAFVIDTTGRITLTFPITATSQEMARDLTRLLEMNP